MQIASFITPLNFRTIVANMSAMLRLFAVILVLPFLFSILAGEFTYTFVFGGLALATALAGWFSRVSVSEDATIKESLVVTALAYLVYASVGAVAFLPVASYVDSLFEAMSGFTTTGLSVLDVARLPKTLLFFRAYSQWIGGAGIVVLSLVMLVGPGRNAFQLYTSEFGEENLVGDVIGTARFVMKAYLALTLVGFLLFVVAGMGWLDALEHVMASVSTGGFSVYENSIGHYDAVSVDLAVIFMMLLGAIGFPSYYLLTRSGVKRFFQDLQVRYLVLIVVVSTLILVILVGPKSESALDSLFRATSAITTTGFSLHVTTSWPKDTWLATLVLMIIGGAAGSTAGGIKLIRLIILFKLIRWYVVRDLLPAEAKLPIRYSGVAFSDLDLRKLFGFATVYFAFLAGSAMLLAFAGFGVSEGAFEAASALSTVGLSAGVTSPHLVAGGKLVLILDMWAGRLEILPVLVAIYPAIWKGRRRST